MTDYKDSPSCKEKQVCSLTGAKDTYSAEYQKEPGVSGPLKGCYFAGGCLYPAILRRLPAGSGGVGEIKTDQQWRVLSQLKNGYQDSLFTSAEVARKRGETAGEIH